MNQSKTPEHATSPPEQFPSWDNFNLWNFQPGTKSIRTISTLGQFQPIKFPTWDNIHPDNSHHTQLPPVQFQPIYMAIPIWNNPYLGQFPSKQLPRRSCPGESLFPRTNICHFRKILKFINKNNKAQLLYLALKIFVFFESTGSPRLVSKPRMNLYKKSH